MKRVPVTTVGRRGDVGGVVVGPSELNQKRVDTILQHACANGVIRLANRNLTQLPREVFFLHEMNFADKRWWEQQMPSTLDVSHNLLTNIEVPTTSGDTSSSECDPLTAFASLRLINASYNKLAAFPTPLLLVCSQTLTKLDLSYNALTSLTVFEVPIADPPTNTLCPPVVDQRRMPQAPSSSAFGYRNSHHHSTVFGPPAAAAPMHNIASGCDGYGHARGFFPSLIELNLSHNALTSVRNIATMCPALEKLNLADNQLREWTEDSSLLAAIVGSASPNVGGRAALRQLSVANNRLTELLWRCAPSTLVSVAMMFPKLMHLDASCNALTHKGLDGMSASRISSRAEIEACNVFPQTLVVLNLKQNRLETLPTLPANSLALLKELYLGNNLLQNEPNPSECDIGAIGFAAPALEMVDVSNNALTDTSFLLPMKGSLSRLDLQNNNFSTLRFEIGFFPRLTSVVLTGNPLRSIRSDIVARGTQELLAFLRSRLPQGSQEAAGRPLGNGDRVHEIDPSVLQQVVYHHNNTSTTSVARRHAEYANGMKPDDRPFATAYNATATLSEAQRQLEEQCARLGEHNGTTWDVSYYGSSVVSAGAGRFARASSSAPPSASTMTQAQQKGAGGLVPWTRFSLMLSIAELHTSGEQKFRDGVRAIFLNHQTSLQAIDLDVPALFPELRELSCAGCASLSALVPLSKRSPQGSMFRALSVLDLSRCGFQTLDVNSTASTLDVGMEALAACRAPISRLSLVCNKHLSVFPSRGISFVASTLQYLRLDDNPQFCAAAAAADSLAAAVRFVASLQCFHELLELSLSNCKLPVLPADDHGGCRVSPGWYETAWPKLQSLDVSCNALTSLPLSIGKMKSHLRVFQVEGNCVRWLRPEVVAKGTHAVLEYLEGRMPQS